jgi:histidine triad (HIT) family protein
MADCILCQIVEGKVPSKKIYEDDDILAVLDINGASPGHSFVMPKQHFTIMEQVPDQIIGRLFQVANKVSSAVFETLDSKGTNIFVTNGTAAGQMVAHFMVNVIPRKENDGINLQWAGKQLTQEEMSTVELQLKDTAKDVGAFEAPQKKEDSKKQKPKEGNDTISDEDNYLVRQLRRIP